MVFGLTHSERESKLWKLARRKMHIIDQVDGNSLITGSWVESVAKFPYDPLHNEG